MGELSVNWNIASGIGDREGLDRNGDLVLIRQVAVGDQAAFTELIELYGNSVAGLIGRLMGWHADCDDILQEVFLLVWQRAGTFSGEGSVEGWMKQIAINRCRNHFRLLSGIRRKMERFAKLVLLGEKQHVESCFEFDDGPSELSNAITGLPDGDRMVLVLFYLEEMPGNQIAEQLGIQPETLHVRLHRARKKLKTVLERVE